MQALIIDYHAITADQSSMKENTLIVDFVGAKTKKRFWGGTGILSVARAVDAGA